MLRLGTTKLVASLTLLICTQSFAGTSTWNTISPMPTPRPDWTMDDEFPESWRTWLMTQDYYLNNYLIDMDAASSSNPAPLIAVAHSDDPAYEVSFRVYSPRSGSSVQLGSTIELSQAQEACECIAGPHYPSGVYCPGLFIDGSFVEISASPTTENGKGVYYVLVGWSVGLEEHFMTGSMHAVLYKVLDDLSYTKLRTYEIKGIEQCWEEDTCSQYAAWRGKAMSIQDNGDGETVQILLSYHGISPSGVVGILADTYPGGIENVSGRVTNGTYGQSLCTAITDLGVSNLPSTSTVDTDLGGYWGIDMDAPYTTSSNENLTSCFSLVAFHTYVEGPPAAFYADLGLVTFGANGGGSLSHHYRPDSTTWSDQCPRVTINPFWETDDTLAFATTETVTGTNPRFSTFKTTDDWETASWTAPGTWSLVERNAAGDTDITFPRAAHLWPQFIGARGCFSVNNTSQSAVFLAHDPDAAPWNYFLPRLEAEKGPNHYNRVFALWRFDGGAPNYPHYRFKRLAGYEVNLLGSLSPQTTSTRVNSKMFTFELKEGFGDVAFRKMRFKNSGDTIHGTVDSARLWIDRDENEAFSSVNDGPSIGTYNVPSSGNNEFVFEAINGYFDSDASLRKDRAVFFVTFTFDAQFEGESTHQIQFHPGPDANNSNLEGIESQNRAWPTSSDDLIYSVIGRDLWYYGPQMTYEN